MRNAVYAGSFDPPTNGHLWMINEAARLFEMVTVVVTTNPGKCPLFCSSDRVRMIEDSILQLPNRIVWQVSPYCGMTTSNIRVVSLEDQFVVNYAATVSADWLVRGIRNASDYEFEKILRQVNADINSSVQTVLFEPPRELAEVSSSLVKGLIGYDGWERLVMRYVQPAVMVHLIGRRQHWLWEELVKVGAKGDEKDFWKTILTPYFAAGRVHHSGAHLSEVLQELESVKGEIRNLAAVGFAAACHDIVMDVNKQNNEMLSSEFALEYAKKLCLPDVFGEKAASMVQASVERESNDPDTQILLDADAAILGYSEARFDEYERGLGVEYSVRYTQKEFAVGRVAWIHGFLDSHKEHLFDHQHFEKKYGASARRNLQRSLHRIADARF